MATELNHTLNFAAPVIPAPTTGIPSTYYNNLNISVSASQCSNDGLEYIITRNNGTHTLFDHYLMMDGDVYFIKQGDPFPTKFVFFNNTVATSNTLLLKINIGLASTFKKYFSNGVPIPKFLLIENIDEASFRVDLKNYIQDSISGTIAVSMGWNPLVSLIMQFLLNNLWDSSGNIGNIIDDKIDHYINTVINNTSSKVGIFMPGGIKIGKVLNNANGSSQFCFKVINSNDTDQIPNYLPAVSYLRQLTYLPNGAKWLLHPLLTNSSNITLPLDFYLKFEIWNPYSALFSNEQKYVNIADGCIVKLMNFGTTNSILEKTILNGKVEFHKSEFDIGYDFDTNNNYYFIVENPSCEKISFYNYHYPENIISLPEKWSTMAESESDYWLSTNGTPGYLKGFNGFRIGDNLNPIIYRIGVDYYFNLYYLNGKNKKNIYNLFPKGIHACLINTDTYSQVQQLKNVPNIGDINYENFINKNKFLTNRNGVVQGITFDIKPNDELGLIVYLKIDNDDLKIKSCKIDTCSFAIQAPKFDWCSFNENIVIERTQKTTIGSFSKPIKISIKDDDTIAGLYITKILTEVAFFFNYFTNGNWIGFTDKIITAHSVLSGSFSIPENMVYIKVTERYERGIIAHELSHQILYDEIPGTGWQLIYKTVIEQGNHHIYDISDKKFALYEGWSEAIEKIFEGTFSDWGDMLLYLDSSDTQEQNYKVNKLTPLPVMTGDRVEGAYANIISTIFWDFVAKNYSGSLNIISEILKFYTKSNITNTDIKIVESDSGYLSDSNKWMSDSNRNILSGRFMNHIYYPFTLMDINFAKTSLHLNNIKDSFANVEKLKINTEFARWNICWDTIIIKSCSVSTINGVLPNVITLTCYNLIIPDNNSITHNSVFASIRYYLQIGIEMAVVFEKENVVKSVISIDFISETEIKVLPPKLSTTGIYDVYVKATVRKGCFPMYSVPGCPLTNGDGYSFISNKIQIGVQ